jgi:hypothetical protein
MDIPPLIKETHASTPELRTMSLAARLLNVFAVPGEVFNEVKQSGHKLSNWLVPSVLGALVGALSMVIILSQPAIQKQFQDRQNRFIEQAEKAGKLSPEERQAASTFTSPSMLRVFGASGAALGSFTAVLWWGFVLWFLARRMLRTPVKFGKALEVAGLAMMIEVLGGIVAVLLIVKLGRIGATPSLALVFQDFDATRKTHLFAAAANLFSFWVVGVCSIGLAKLTDVPYLRAAWLVVTFWVLQQSFFVITGLGQLAM